MNGIDLSLVRPNILDRFWDKVDRSGDCWEWTAEIARNGYGRFKVHRGRGMYAHRFIDIALNGEMPSGIQTLHKCDNRSCVRPSHLFRGTQMDNIRDMMNKGREPERWHRMGDLRLRAKVSPDQVVSIRHERKCGVNVSDLSRRYDLSSSQIKSIVSGRSWGHIREGLD